MNWTEPSKPNNECYYDHVKVDTPLGLITIEWKSWKERPSYDVMLDEGEWIGAEYSLEKAKKLAEDYLKLKVEDLKIFLEL